MASYHCSVKIGSRSLGRNSLAAAAYRHALRLEDEVQRKVHDYTQKQGVVFSGLLIPGGAPEWAKNRQKLWSGVERVESRINSQLFREAEISLPRELSLEQQIELVQKWAQEQFVDRGMVADIAIHHDNPKNPHAHIMLTMREFDGGGWAKHKNRDWNQKALLMEWRESWARATNLALKVHGYDLRIDHRSHADRGLPVFPTIKQGRMSQRIAQERLAANNKVLQDNGEYLLRHPEDVLFLCEQEGRATWAWRDILRVIHRHTLTDEQFQSVRAAVGKSPELVRLKRENGSGIYTSRSVQLQEKKLLLNASALMQRGKFSVSVSGLDSRLSEEQRGAVEHICGGLDLAIVEGAPGVGKSFMLSSAVKQWEDKGYRVLAGSLQSFQCRKFAQESGIKEHGSIARWLTLWKHGRDELNGKSIIVIDEAGMVGTDQMQKMLGHAVRQGAKVVLVGDTEQLPAIAHGSPLRALIDKYGAHHIDIIRRQSHAWQRQAIMDIRAGDGAKGFDSLESHGCIKSHQSREQALESMVDRWWQLRSEGSGSDVGMLAFRRRDVKALNALARDRLRQEGVLPSGGEILKDGLEGDVPMVAGDEVMFRQPSRLLDVLNGTTGRVVAVTKERIDVRTDGGFVVAVDFEHYRDEKGRVPIQHAYAATGHKSQGETIDAALVYADPLLSHQEWLLVASSRNRSAVEVHHSKPDLSRDKLRASFSSSQKKDMALDYREEAAKPMIYWSRDAMVHGPRDELQATLLKELKLIRENARRFVSEARYWGFGSDWAAKIQKQCARALKACGRWQEAENVRHGGEPNPDGDDLRRFDGLVSAEAAAILDAGTALGRFKQELEREERLSLQRKKALAIECRHRHIYDLSRDAMVHGPHDELQGKLLKELKLLKGRSEQFVSEAKDMGYGLEQVTALREECEEAKKVCDRWQEAVHMRNGCEPNPGPDDRGFWDGLVSSGRAAISSAATALGLLKRELELELKLSPQQKKDLALECRDKHIYDLSLDAIVYGPRDELRGKLLKELKLLKGRSEQFVSVGKDRGYGLEQVTALREECKRAVKMCDRWQEAENVRHGAAPKLGWGERGQWDGSVLTARDDIIRVANVMGELKGELKRELKLSQQLKKDCAAVDSADRCLVEMAHHIQRVHQPQLTASQLFKQQVEAVVREQGAAYRATVAKWDAAHPDDYEAMKPAIAHASHQLSEIRDAAEENLDYAEVQLQVKQIAADARASCTWLIENEWRCLEAQNTLGALGSRHPTRVFNEKVSLALQFIARPGSMADRVDQLLESDVAEQKIAEHKLGRGWGMKM